MDLKRVYHCYVHFGSHCLSEMVRSYVNTWCDITVFDFDSSPIANAMKNSSGLLDI